MSKDLTTSSIHRQNILNNPFALEKIQEHFDFKGTLFENEQVYTKAKVAELLGVDTRTIERYVKNHTDEFGSNGYRVLKGKSLKIFKLQYVSDTGVGEKAATLGVFNFRAILNLAMVLTESERAREIRSRVLDIVLDVIAKKTGGHTRFINQRAQDYLPASYQEFSYRKLFTDALRDYVDMGGTKYRHFTNLIYQAIFKEDAAEYRRILNITDKSRTRDTMYSEVLELIASFESGIADQLKERSAALERKLTQAETEELFKASESNPFIKPYIEGARTRMASRDLCFRDALHDKLEGYIQSVPAVDFEKFLGETSKNLSERLEQEEVLSVFKRLKDR
ncbi:DNA-binding protein [Leucothrix arctica]|uniref:DNA-binding protein n=1 Tax=Leucothrix arctica TaxID=1481894 RepID=A0A317CPU4_9GAMM|nr:DNA-binding protein [Leucothrix arctica]PWQ98332.1 DNA-binding protein [Leucothrix arctica]